MEVPPTRARRWPWLLAAAVVLALGAAAWHRWRSPAPPTEAELRAVLFLYMLDEEFERPKDLAGS